MLKDNVDFFEIAVLKLTIVSEIVLLKLADGLEKEPVPRDNEGLLDSPVLKLIVGCELTPVIMEIDGIEKSAVLRGGATDFEKAPVLEGTKVGFVESVPMCADELVLKQCCEKWS